MEQNLVRLASEFNFQVFLNTGISEVVVMVRTSSRNVGKYTVTRKSKQYKRTNHGTHPASTIVTRSQCNVSGSMFHRLPLEVFYMILDKLTGTYG